MYYCFGDLLVVQAFSHVEVSSIDIPTLNAGTDTNREECILVKDARSKARSWLLDP